MLDQEPRYESYKNSGVPWIGDAPEDWQILPGRACLYENKDKNTGMIEETVLSLSYGTVRVKPVEEQVGLMPESYETYQIVRPGDIIIRGTDLQNDVTSLRTGLAKNNGIITSAYINLRPRPNVSPFYLHYLLHSYDLMKVFYGLGSGLRQNLSYEDFKKIPLPYPDLDTQNRIVNFLDEKTTEIDAAIAKKRQLIDLLNEQKVILINRAVTKGLNPSAPMKDSGVDWTGEIPAHWGVKRLKYATQIFRGKFTHRPRNDPRLYDGEYPFLQTGDVAQSGKFIESYKQTLNKKGLRVSTLVPKGTVVITIAANIGDIAILGFDTCFPDSVVGFRPKFEVTRDFVYHSLSSMKHQFMLSAIQNAQMNLNVERIGSNFIPLPPACEQNHICEELDRIVDISLEISNAAESGITTLNEFKQTLIANAVTGKIKI